MTDYWMERINQAGKLLAQEPAISGREPGAPRAPNLNETGQRTGKERVSDGAFFTGEAGATALAEMAVDDMDCDWSDLDAIAALKVTDPAVGAGALLLGVLRAVRKRYLSAGGTDAAGCSRVLVERVLTGHDIDLPSLHQARDALLAEVDGPCGNPLLWCWPHGPMPDGSVRCGVLEMLDTGEDGRLNFGDREKYPPVRVQAVGAGP